MASEAGQQRCNSRYLRVMANGPTLPLARLHRGRALIRVRRTAAELDYKTIDWFIEKKPGKIR